MLVSRSPVDFKELGIDENALIMFDFDPLHNLLVLAQGFNYHILIGEETEKTLAEKYAALMEKSQKRKLDFTLAKSSILDNNIKMLAMKNMRLYLVDSEYSMIVFTISISE